MTAARPGATTGATLAPASETQKVAKELESANWDKHAYANSIGARRDAAMGIGTWVTINEFVKISGEAASEHEKLKTDPGPARLASAVPADKKLAGYEDETYVKYRKLPDGTVQVLNKVTVKTEKDAEGNPLKDAHGNVKQTLFRVPPAGVDIRLFGPFNLFTAHQGPSDGTGKSKDILLPGAGFFMLAVFPPLALAAIPFMPFLMKNDYSRWLLAKDQEMKAMQELQGVKTVIIDWDKGKSVDFKQLRRLIKLAERNGMGVELGDEVIRQLKEDYSETKYYDRFTKMAAAVNEKRDDLELRLNMDKKPLLKKTKDLFDKQTKLDKEFDDPDLTEDERKDKYKDKILNDEAGQPKVGKEKVDAIEAAVDGLGSRAGELNAAAKRLETMNNSYQALINNPERLNEAPKSPGYKSGYWSAIRKHVKAKFDNTKPEFATGVEALGHIQQKLSDMEDSVKELKRAFYAEQRDVRDRMVVLEAELTREKATVAALPESPDKKARSEAVEKQLQEIKTLKATLDSSKTKFTEASHKFIASGQQDNTFDSQIKAKQIDPAMAAPTLRG